jgi:hypothetical protein
MFRVHYSLFLVVVGSFVVTAHAADEEPGAKNLQQEPAPFRPEAGKFPSLEKAHAYRGELVFVDHANRRGSLRVEGTGKFYRNDPHPFTMLPYGIVRYQGGPADLRDIPLGTVMHARAFLPPDPKTSAVPVLPVDSKSKDAGHYRGTGIFPAENHVVLLEDEPSHCLREGLVWKLHEVDVKNGEGTITATRAPKQGGDAKAAEDQMTFDSATRIWRGSERIDVARMVAEAAWPASGKKKLGGQPVHLGITWKPAPGDGLAGAFTRFHISDIWLDEAAIEQAAHFQTETHKAFIRSRWMPAWVDAVEYGRFGRATVTATLFGGMDASLYADFQPGAKAQINGAENTLKHAAATMVPATSPPAAGSRPSPRPTGRSRSAPAASRSASRPTSSSKASGPRASSGSARRVGPAGNCPAKNTSTTASKSGSRV